MTYSPDAQAVEEQIQDEMKDSYREADPENTEKMDKLDQLDELLDDPEIKQILLDRIDDQ